MSAPAPTPAEQQQIDRFGIFDEEAGAWRVGRHFPIHVYEGDEPIATFHRPEDAALAVAAVAAYRAQDGGADLDGATDVGDPRCHSSTPGEFAARWNARTDEQRANHLRWIQEDADVAQRCRVAHAPLDAS